MGESMDHKKAYSIPTACLSISDERVFDVIQTSRESFGCFCTSFEARRPGQDNFIVVFLENVGDFSVPVGMFVESIRGDRILGRRVSNRLELLDDGPASCERRDIIDWRYVDAYEMEGGALYRKTFSLQPERVQATIRDVLPFLISRESEDPGELRDVFRSIAHHDASAVRDLISRGIEPANVSSKMPVRCFGRARRVVEVEISIPEYAAMYGDAETIDILHQNGSLDEMPGRSPPLIDASFQGNTQVVQRFLELGYSPDAVGMFRETALFQAAKWGHYLVVDCLIRGGADVNFRNVREQTPLFQAASADVAGRLIEAGADVNASSDTGETPLAIHWRNGRWDVVKLLIERGATVRGAGRDIVPPGVVGVTEFVAAQRNGSKAGQMLEELDLANSIDFGFVLPVRAFRSE